MRGIKHPNVVKLYDYIKEGQALIMEFCSKGSLEKFLESQTEPIPWDLRFYFIGKLATLFI